MADVCDIRYKYLNNLKRDVNSAVVTLPSIIDSGDRNRDPLYAKTAEYIASTIPANSVILKAAVVVDEGFSSSGSANIKVGGTTVTSTSDITTKNNTISDVNLYVDADTDVVIDFAIGSDSDTGLLRAIITYAPMNIGTGAYS